jgi:tetratricopeptide (TPR) repeat protein
MANGRMLSSGVGIGSYKQMRLLLAVLISVMALPAQATLTETISPMLSTTLTAVLRDQQSGQYDQARHKLLHFLRRYPKHPVATAALADLYMRQVQLYQLTHLALPQHDLQDRAKVYQQLQAAHQQYPDHPRLLAAWQRWQRLFARPANPTSLVWQDSYQPAKLAQYQQWSKTEMDKQNWFAAKQIALVALELGPSHPDSYLLMSELLLATDHPTEAARFAQQSALFTKTDTPSDRLLALQHKLQEARMDALPRVSPTEGEAQTTALPAVDVLAPLTDKKLAVTLAELHAMLPLARSEQQTAQVWEALTGLGIHLQRSGKPVNPGLLRQYQQELALSQQQPLAYSQRFALSAERLKQLMGQPPTYTPLTQTPDDQTAGLALFLAGDYAKANERLDAIDGGTPEGYMHVADVLMLHHAFVMAETMARRGLQMGDLPGLRNTLLAIEQQRELARKAVTYGDVDQKRKDWASAQQQFEQASRISPEWETPYLRLGELMLKRNKPAAAYAQYSQAVKITPSLLSSPSFSKKYHKLAARNGSLK